MEIFFIHLSLSIELFLMNLSSAVTILFMSTVISELFLVFHFSLVFSLTLLCSVLYFKTRDTFIFSFLRLLWPLFFYMLIVLLYYLYGKELNLHLYRIAPAISLLMLVFVSFMISLVVYGTSSYLLSLLDISDRELRFGQRIVILCSFIFFLFSLFFIIYLNGADWQTALSRALNELFLYGSLFLLLPAIVATIFLKKNSSREKRRLLADIMISFYPMILYFALDTLFFLGSPFKLTYLSYSIFAFLIYFFISRHYIHRYEPEKQDLTLSIEEFYRAVNLSEREREIIPMLIEGKSNRDISEELFISHNTVKTHIRNIYKKTEVSNRLQLLYKIRNNP